MPHVSDVRDAVEAVAVANDIPFRRFHSHDRFGYLKVLYEDPFGLIFVGSEILGRSAIDFGFPGLLLEHLKALHDQDFNRIDFIDRLRFAIGRLDASGQCDGRRARLIDIYRVLALAPETRTGEGRRYRSTAQFCFDLARFAEGGWTCDGLSVKPLDPWISKNYINWAAALRNSFTLPIHPESRLPAPTLVAIRMKGAPPPNPP
jgi:hypothetical protein